MARRIFQPVPDGSRRLSGALEVQESLTDWNRASVDAPDDGRTIPVLPVLTMRLGTGQRRLR